jgi:Tol biopolymer transport system component
MKRTILFCLLVLVPLLLVAQTTRVSVASNGTQAADNSYNPSISSDGRYVAFMSRDRHLVQDDTNGMPDIFVHDVRTGQTTRVSIASDGTEGNMGSYYSSISFDGRYVAFTSWANNLVDNDSNGVFDVFVHDRTTGQTTRASIDSAGNQGDGHCQYPSISSDGRYVAFSSLASNLVDGDTNGAWDVFVHDRQTGQTSRVSVASNGTQGNMGSSGGFISPDSRYVAFGSLAANLVESDINGTSDVFVHDRTTGQTTNVSVASDGTQGNSGSGSPSISSDGRYVAFSSLASNLVDGDTNPAWDVFVHDRQTGQTRRVSVASDGTQGNGKSYQSSISSNGRYVAFTSWASNLVDDDTNWYPDIFVHDRLTGQTTSVSVTSDGMPGNDYSYYPSISSDGQYVAFESIASNLVANDTNDSYDIFVAKIIGPVYWPPAAIDNYIGDLPDNCFKNNAKQRKNAFHNKLMEVQDLIDAGYYQEAINKLSHDIRGKVDGIGKNNWIICSYAREELTAVIDSLIEYLEGLL